MIQILNAGCQSMRSFRHSQWSEKKFILTKLYVIKGLFFIPELHISSLGAVRCYEMIAIIENFFQMYWFGIRKTLPLRLIARYSRGKFWSLSEESETTFLELASFIHCCSNIWTSQVALVVKNTPANAGDITDMGLIPELGRSPGGGHGKPSQCSCLENPIERCPRGLQVH